MPVFSDTTVTPAQKRDVIAYITKVRSEPNPGGFSLGRVGPVTEGLVAFLGGIAVLVFVAIWITMKRREA
jgi:ubiquinol-cytochrome c reductase cytochrome c subunit